MTLLQLLAEGRVEEFNSRRGRRAALDLFAADLSGAQLAGVDLSGANLEKADLSGAVLRNAVLAKADLSGADLTGADLTRAIAVRAKLREAYLGEAVLDEIDLTGADLTEAVLDDATGVRILLRGARVKGAEAHRASFPQAQAEGAKLDRARFDNADLSQACLSECSFVGASFEGANLSGADLSQARGTNANMKGATVSGAILERSDLSASDLTDADFSNARLVQADLGDAIVTHCRFDGADLTHARLEGVDLGSAEIANAIGARPPGMSLELANDHPRSVQFEDVRAAVHNGHVALYWENEDDDTTLVNRIAIVSREQPFRGVAPALPAPAELTLAREIVQIQGRFAAVTFLDRPGGVELVVSHINDQGRVAGSNSVRLGYELAVQPIVRGGERLRVYGLGRRGPALHAHTLIDGELRHQFSQRASTAIGLVDEVIATRGGVLVPITVEGLGDPVQEPRGFHARMASSTRVGDELSLAWLPSDQPGFLWAKAAPGKRPEVHCCAEPHAVTSLTTATIAGRPTVFFCREISQHGACGLWEQELDHGTETREVLVDERFDIDDVRVIGIEGDKATLLCTTLQDELVLVAWQQGRARVVEILGA